MTEATDTLASSENSAKATDEASAVLGGADIETPIDPFAHLTPDERNWYVVKVQPEREERISGLIKEQIRQHGWQDLIRQVLIPTIKEVEFKGGKKKDSTIKTYPGYLFLDIAELTTELFFVLTEINGISGFVGADPLKPEKLPTYEMDKILRSMESQKKDKPRAKIEFEVGQRVRIKDGPFVNYEGVVEEIYPDRGALRVMIHIFGRGTPVELEFSQVGKV